MRIFVVENHPDSLKYLKRYLESLGHSVTTACTMQAALAASPTEDCDVLLCDIGLPDGNGWELMEQARFRQPVYAVAMSGFAAESDLQRSKAAGFRRHIVKPFGGEDLRLALEEAADEIKRDAKTKGRGSLPPPRKKPGAEAAARLTPGQIADRLHDSVCQSLSAARFLLNAVHHQLPRDAGELREQLKSVDRQLDESCKDVSALMNELRTEAEGTPAQRARQNPQRPRLDEPAARRPRR